MRISAVVPVKSFSKSKTRLQLPVEKRTDLCKIMLEEVLCVIKKSNLFEKIVIVSKDEEALKISKKFGVDEIYDYDELGVNKAVNLADKYSLENKMDASIIFPQDIPFLQVEDIQALLHFQTSSNCVLVVPSRKYDGTNALFRTPVDIMGTHYDEDSYKIHLDTAYSCSNTSSLVLIRRIMLDIDDSIDLEYALLSNEKPSICSVISSLIDQKI